MDFVIRLITQFTKHITQSLEKSIRNVGGVRESITTGSLEGLLRLFYGLIQSVFFEKASTEDLILFRTGLQCERTAVDRIGLSCSRSIPAEQRELPIVLESICQVVGLVEGVEDVADRLECMVASNFRQPTFKVPVVAVCLAIIVVV